MRKFLIVLTLLCGYCATTQAAVTSYDHVFVPADQYASDFYSRLNANFTRSLTGGINSINAANVVDDSLTEAEMADDVNPRIRTYEGAACEFVASGLLPVTSANLTSNISAGTAYPRGYRINKGSATAKTYTASKDTYVDIDINGDFQYSEVANGAAAPAVASNSIRLAKVVTSGTAITAVTDLRKTSCSNGPFNVVVDTVGEASLGDLFRVGAPYKKSGSNGWIQGAYVSRDAATTFKVLQGSVFINGLYRAVSSDISVTTGVANPGSGISGIDTGGLAASTKYNVFLAADQASVGYSVVYSASSTPSVGTNIRKISEIWTDTNSRFTSADIVQVNNINPQELSAASVTFDGTADALRVNRKYNVASVTRTGTGTYTVTFDKNMIAPYTCVASATATENVATDPRIAACYSKTASTFGVTTEDENGSGVDCANVNVTVFGEPA